MNALDQPLAARLAAASAPALGAQLDSQGFALLPALLTPAECEALAALYARDQGFRSRVVMERHGFGRGEYKYFDYPLPELVAGLREALYTPLAPIANRWSAALGWGAAFPSQQAAFRERCHAAGQRRPTPLLLRYGPGDYNCLHQDLYGTEVFPVQVALLLSRPGIDFTGGEFVLTEQCPRRQSRPMVVSWQQGDALAFAVHQRPVAGARGPRRVSLRHGVSRVHSGQRHVLGIIFHDAA
jgi:hypothetical protein